MSSRQRIKAKKIRRITNGIFSTVTDITLYTLYLIGSSFGNRSTSRDVYKTFSEADELLLNINYQTFDRALQKLKEQGLMNSLKKWTYEPIITQKGRQKLLTMTPIYDDKRIWDKDLYLISYDIETAQNAQRATFRLMLKRLGTIKLQESLYLTCYNPALIFSEFLEENNLKENVLIYQLGKAGFIGKKNLIEFLWEKANLEEVNNSYHQFIQRYKSNKSFSKTQMAIDYYSIIKDDPQLPFELLPDKYLGDEANLLFQESYKIP